MKMLKEMISYLKSIGSFLHALFRRKDSVVRVSSSGYGILEGWEHSPEEAILKDFKKLRNTKDPKTKAALFCYSGLHEGEVFPLMKNRETLGTDSENTRVITPKESTQGQRYQVLLNGSSKLIAEPGATFRLNGSAQQEQELYDFDELEFFDGRFLYLDLTSHGRNLSEVIR